MSPRPANASRADIIAMLQEGHSNSRIAGELRVDKHRVRRIREELGLPAYVPIEQTRTIEEKWKLYARPVDGGHIEWTGERVGAAGTPVMRYKDGTYSPAAIAFEMQHGRPPQGYAIADCGHKRCIAPDHVDDEAGRQAKRQELRRSNGLDDRQDTCPYGHDHSTHGRLERDGRPYCEACKRERKAEPEAQREVRAKARETLRRDIETLLRKNIPQMHIAKQLGVAPATVQRTREALGLPAPRCGPRERYGSLAEAFHANTEAIDDGHLRWKRSTPHVCYRQQRIPAARVSFELHHGRQPVGPVLTGCGMDGCVAGGHLEDRPMREANKRADKAFAAIFGTPA
ncbi:hypothetical protein [Streptomyces cahuitamycinicus]|uniref:Uncharacterized protein n=1 Tax=Streptomyces cahuitamycinicus TaxID=2070367 RepID=A0A2N8TLA2_9ACTN|nr:hypothetical protein [Streptomyces cahuitamycinicus]PNG19739.1 hypothetical protein C1J00_24045 [Streptomyces cahuitamycinicus]